MIRTVHRLFLTRKLLMVSTEDTNARWVVPKKPRSVVLQSFDSLPVAVKPGKDDEFETRTASIPASGSGAS